MITFYMNSALNKHSKIIHNLLTNLYWCYRCYEKLNTETRTRCCLVFTIWWGQVIFCIIFRRSDSNKRMCRVKIFLQLSCGFKRRDYLNQSASDVIWAGWLICFKVLKSYRLHNKRLTYARDERLERRILMYRDAGTYGGGAVSRDMTMLSKITFFETKPSKVAIRLFTIEYILPTLLLTMKFQKKTPKYA